MLVAECDPWAATRVSKPVVGETARRTRRTVSSDIERFTEITGDRNPLHYDRALAEASVFGQLIVQGGITSGLLNAVVAEDLPGPGTVFLDVAWRFVKAVGVDEEITGEVEVLSVRDDKPICRLRTRVMNAAGEECLIGEATVYVAALRRTEGQSLGDAKSAPSPVLVGTPAVATATDRHAWGVLTMVSLSIVLSMTTWFSATAIIPELRAAWGLSGTAAAWLTNAVQIGFVVGALGSSLLNLPDVLPPRWLMTASAILAALANATLLAAPSAELVILARFLTGVALAGVYPPAMKVISSWFARGRGLALGCVIGALTLGSAFPHLLRAVTTALDWHAVVAAPSVMTLVGAGLMALCVREGPFAGRRAVFDPRQIGRVLRDRPVALANLGYFGHMWELYAMWGWFLAFALAYQTEAGGTGPSASLIAFVVIASGAVGCVLGGLLADRLGRTLTTAAMMAISGTCAILIGLTFHGPLWLMLAIAIVWGVTVIADSAQFSACVTEIVDPTLTGTALALQLGLGFALTVVALWAVPAFAAWAGGWQWAFLILAPGPAVGAWAMLALRRCPESIKIAQGRR